MPVVVRRPDGVQLSLLPVLAATQAASERNEQLVFGPTLYWLRHQRPCRAACAGTAAAASITAAAESRTIRRMETSPGGCGRWGERRRARDVPKARGVIAVSCLLPVPPLRGRVARAER